MLAALLSAALADTPALDREALVRAEWARDVSTLLAGPYEDADLARVALALGRTRDPAVLERLGLLASLSDPEVRAAAYAALASVPGAAPLLRAALGREADPERRADLWRALGHQGDVTDVPGLVAALGRPSPEGAGAAKALGRLARAGVDVGAAIGALAGAAGGRDRERADIAAWALSRARPAALPPGDRERLLAAWRRSPREEVRAWLLPVLLDTTDEAGRRNLATEVMAGPWRAAKVALLAPTSPVSWTDADLAAWSADPDAWVRQRLREMTGAAIPAEDPELAALREGGNAAARTAVVALALDGSLAPARRTAAAAALLERTPSAAELEVLLTAPDAVVRELAAEHLGEQAGGAGRLGRALAGEAEPTTQAALLDALARRVRDGERLDDDGLDAVAALARTGPFLVRGRAVELARALGRPVDPLPVDPGPADLDRDLASVGRLAVARVLTTQGELRVVLEPGVAPLAVSAFAWLAEHDAFDGLPFHRVVPAFVVQTGDPRGDGLGGPGWFLPDETSDLPFLAGTVGMARSGPDTGGSQWFVVTTDQPHLAGDYTRFGVLSSGLDVARRLGPEDRVLDVRIERTP